MLGSTIAHYRITGQLGAGGMGVVYEAEDTRLGRHVALKFLPEAMNLSAEAGERFEREARIASSLNHPNICTIHDIGIDNGRRFIVMELLHGQSLRARIAGRPLPVDLVLDVGCQIADALDAAHARGIVHRDVKPANLFITTRGQAKLLDFGVAKPGGSDGAGSSIGDEATHVAPEALTTPGTAVGSVNYMSPEQARGDPIDGRTDLFSLGIVLYEMATGRQAFSGQTAAVVFDAILNRDPAPAGEFNPELPAELTRVIGRALEKDRRMRYQTAADLLAELSCIRRDSSGRTKVAATTAVSAPSVDATSAAAPSATATPAARFPVAPRRRRWALVGVPAVLVVAVAGFWLWSSIRTPAFTERDLVVIADFANTTGDAVFSDALKQAVSVQLQQTPYVTLLGDQQVQRTLRLMQHKPDDPVTAAVAREVCQRAGAKATVEGSIAPLGSSYVIALGVHNCQTGESIAQQQVQASSKEAVLKALGDAVTDLRRHLGESLASVAKNDVPAEATTSSLEALQAYGLALKTRATKSDEESIPFFKQAIDRDPNFALAYAKLSVVNSNSNHADEARTYAQRAYDLRDRVSEYERLYIIWNYASRVTHDDKLTLDTLQLLTTSYPRDFSARHNLGVYYQSKDQIEEASKQFQAAADIAPSEPLPIANVASSLFMLGRLDEAYAATAKALAVRPNPGLAVTRWVDARLAGDARATEFEAAARKLATSNQLVSADADLAVWDGRLAEFRRLAAEARAENQAAKNASIVAEIDLQAAVTLAALQRGQYLEDLRRYLEPSQPVPIVAATARTFALAGDVKTVRGVLPRLEQALDDKAPADQNTREATTVARAYVKAADGHGKDAIADLDALIHEFPRSQDINYSIGHIRETMGDLDEAAAAYRRVIDAHVMLGTHMTVPATRLALGQLLAKRGDAAGAKEQFDILRAQWKSADADFMMLQALKSVNGQ